MLKVTEPSRVIAGCAVGLSVARLGVLMCSALVVTPLVRTKRLQ